MVKDFDMEKVIDDMRAIKEKRELEIMQQEMDKINLDSDYDKKLPQNKVLNVKYLGTVEINGVEKRIYLLIEQQENLENGELTEIEKYYTEDGECLGGNNKSDGYDYMMIKEEYQDIDGLEEQLQELDTEGVLDLNELEQERLERIALALGIDPEDIESLVEIDPEQVLELEEKLEKEEIDGNNEEVVPTKEEIEEMSSKTEIDVNQKVTDDETIALLLNIQTKGYVKIAIVYSDKIKDNHNTAGFSVVGLKADKTTELVDTLEQVQGNNPTKTINSLNEDGSEIEEKKANSIYAIKGDDENQVAVTRGSMGTIEVDYVRTPREDNQKAISIPIETQSVRPTTTEVRELMNKEKNPRVKEKIGKIEEHKEVGCEDVEARDIDDNPENDSHKHIEIDEDYLNAKVEEIMKDPDIEEVFTEGEVKGKLEANIKQYLKGGTDEQSLEDVIKNVERELGEDAVNLKHR